MLEVHFTVIAKYQSPSAEGRVTWTIEPVETVISLKRNLNGAASHSSSKRARTKHETAPVAWLVAQPAMYTYSESYAGALVRDSSADLYCRSRSKVTQSAKS